MDRGFFLAASLDKAPSADIKNVSESTNSSIAQSTTPKNLYCEEATASELGTYSSATMQLGLWIKSLRASLASFSKFESLRRSEHSVTAFGVRTI